MDISPSKRSRCFCCRGGCMQTLLCSTWGNSSHAAVSPAVLFVPTLKNDAWVPVQPAMCHACDEIQAVPVIPVVALIHSKLRCLHSHSQHGFLSLLCGLTGEIRGAPALCCAIINTDSPFSHSHRTPSNMYTLANSEESCAV